MLKPIFGLQETSWTGRKEEGPFPHVGPCPLHATVLAFFLDLLRPPQVDGTDPSADASRYRLVMGLAWGLCLIALFYIGLDFRHGMSVFSLGMTGLIGMAGVIRVMVHRRRPIAKIGQVITIGLFLAATFVTLHSGGSQATSIAWYAMLPLCAALLSGPGSGMAWAGVSLVSVLVMGRLSQLGCLRPGAQPEAGSYPRMCVGRIWFQRATRFVVNFKRASHRAN